jgi:uncharacterized protein (TIGR02117 family)
LKRFFIISLKSIGILLCLVILYFISAYVLSNISVNSDFEPCAKDPVEIYVLSNGVHTDIVVPIRNDHMDWSKFVDPRNTFGGDTNKLNVAFGWGDKGFYLHTKTWDDLEFSTAFKAVFHLSTSAMHVTFYRTLKESEHCKKIVISKEQYQKLIGYIKNSFQLSGNGKALQIAGEHYEDNDAFYEGMGSYSLFYTCNTWTNCGLKEAGLKARVWTPFESNILELYP